MTEIKALKKCVSCGKEKPYTQFWRNRTRPDGLRRECIPCGSVVNLRRPVVKARLPAPVTAEHADIAAAYAGWAYPVDPSRLFATVAPLFVPEVPDAFTGQAANP